MELVNQTPVAAQLDVTLEEEDKPRRGMLVAKATFCIDPLGKLSVDDQDPFPLFDIEEPTELGPLPGDQMPRKDDKLDVVLIGAAYARGGRPASSVEVSMRIGEVAHRMVVTGDRYWKPTSGGHAITRPEPFTRMPMTYARAFGGRGDVWIDPDTFVELIDRFNPEGRGFDLEAEARGLAQLLEPAQGYPRFEALRTLPNLEHPDHRITRWEDAPAPYCWGTLSPDMPFAHAAFIRRAELLAQAKRDAAEDPLMTPLAMEALTHRAHPDWVLEFPPAGTQVTCTNVTESGHLSFMLPQLRIVADYVAGPRTGSRELIPQLLVILPEQMKLYIVYRMGFSIDPAADDERSFRLRLESGWYQPPGRA